MLVLDPWVESNKGQYSNGRMSGGLEADPDVRGVEMVLSRRIRSLVSLLPIRASFAVPI